MRVKSLALLFLLLITTVTSAFAAKQGLPEQKIPYCFGVAIHLLGEQDAQMKQIADAGFRVARMDLFWFNNEKEKGKYDFTDYDKLLASMEKYGIKPYFIIAYGNELYSGSKNDKIAPATPEYRKAYAAYAAAAAKHFKGHGVIWELWNEPNVGGFWQPTPNCEQYIAAAKEAAAAIKAADPDAYVVGPTSFSIDYAFLQDCFKRGLLKFVDGVSLHPYGGEHWPPDKVVGSYANVKKMIQDNGGNQPIISGEWGFCIASMAQEDQARYLTRMMLTNISCGIPVSIWYDWHDDGDDPKNWEHTFGVVARDFTPKLSYKAMQMLTKQLNGYSFVRRLNVGAPEDFVLVFSNGKEFRLAAWNMYGPKEISLKASAPATIVTDMLGNRKKGEISDGTLKLSISPTPVYVSCPYDIKALDIK